MLLTSEQVMSWIGVKRPEAARRWLNEHRVAGWHDHKDKPITTLEAINKALLDSDEGEVEL